MNLDYLLLMTMFVLALYGLISSRNVIKTIIFLNVSQTIVILFFLRLLNISGGQIPVIGNDPTLMVDPLPQAMMLTTIVIGAAITALLLMLSIKMFHHFGTLSWQELFEKEG